MNTKSTVQRRTSRLAHRLTGLVLAVGPVAVIVVEVAGKFIP